MDLFDQSNQIQNLFNESSDKQKVQKEKPVKAKKKNTKADYATQMQNAAKTPFICKNHEGVHMKIRETKGSATCNSCGFKCEGKSGFISCPKQSTCYNICSACKVCPKNHILRNCVSLTQFQDKNALYGQNKFKCAGCSHQQKVGTEGVMHCPSCSFSICMECMNKLLRIWQIRSQQSISQISN